MFKPAAEFEREYYNKAKDYVDGRIAGNLSPRALAIITHNFTKPLVLAAGRHQFLERMTTFDDMGNLHDRAVIIGYAPYAILFGSANFDQEAAVLKIVKSEPDYRIRDLLQQAKRVGSYSEGQRLIGCVFTGDEIVKLDTPIEVKPASDQSSDVQSLPDSQKSLATLKKDEETSLVIPERELITPEQKVEYVRLLKETLLQFYAYATLSPQSSWSGSRYELKFHPFSDFSHSILPADGQESIIEIFELSKRELKGPVNMSDYCVRNFPWAPARWETYPESDPQQLVGGMMYSNQLVYITDISKFNYLTVGAAISSAVS